MAVYSVSAHQNNNYFSDKKSKNNDFLTKSLPLGFAIFSTDVAIRGFNKENRCDSFVKTAEKCAQSYTTELKGDFSSFFKKFLKMETTGNWIEKIGNKKMFAFLLVSETLLNASIVNTVCNWFKKLSSK